MVDTQHFYRTLWKLALPIVIQNLATAALNLVDTVMIGQLGAVEVAAVGLANRFYTILTLILFALSTGTAIFTAQFWGKRDVHLIGKPTALALICAVTSAAIFSVTALFMPGAIMRVFTTDPAVIESGSAYFRIVAFSYILMALTYIYSGVLRSTEHVTLPMFASSGALCLNTLLNYCLILGHFGFPRMGVAGAAIATLISRFVEASLILAVAYGKKYPTVAIADFFAIPSTFIRQFSRFTLPVVINEFLWVIGFTMYSVVYGRMSTAAIAAINIGSPVEQIALAGFFGIGNAAAIMLGNQIGAGREDTAFAYAKKFIRIIPVGAVIVGGLMAASSPVIVSWFQVSPEVRSLAMKVLLVSSVILGIKSFNYLAGIGMFRSGGDTKYALYWDVGTTWFTGVPLAFLGGFVWELPVYWVLALACSDEVCRLFLAIQRIHSKKWIHNVASHG